MDHPNKKSIRKHKPQVADQTDLTDICRAFHLKAAEYTFFSSALGTSSWIDPMQGHKANFGQFEKTEILSSIISYHDAMKLEIK